MRQLQMLESFLDLWVSKYPSLAVAAAAGTLNGPSVEIFRGKTSLGSCFRACDENTIFDLASLTKILSTTLVSALAVSQKKISLSEAPFPNWPSIQIQDLLQHKSGLPAWRDFSLLAHDRSQIHAAVTQMTVPADSPRKTIYSDVGFIALGHFLEQRLGKKLDRLYYDLASQFLPDTNIFYISDRPKNGFSLLEFAPTGYCQIRKRKLQGEVNDLNASIMGGIAPHAGLFSRLLNVVISAKFLLSAIKYRKTPFENTLAHFAKAKGSHAIGFDKVSPGGSTGGLLSPEAFGHLGFTGTSLWIDPLAANQKGAYFILLTNRLESNISSDQILQIRQIFHRLSLSWLKSQY